MKHRRESYKRQALCPASGRHGFTLIELLIVLAIIGLLAAILFPAFQRAKEGGYQANCAANLQQIQLAVHQYRQDEKYYPSSLAFLLPADYNLDDGSATGTPNTNGAGYFKGGRDALICKDDDSDAGLVRSSYGDISVSGPPASSADMSRYLWNYWGYKPADAANCNATNTAGCPGVAFLNPTEAETAGNADKSLLLNSASTATYNARSNPIKYSLSNRYAPTSTIITHCVYHRLPTASGKISGPYDVYTDANGAMARDIILRLDGTARVLDISAFATNNNWQKQNF